MYKYLSMTVSLTVAALLFTATSVANAEVRSNVKPIPKAFVGEWVGINRD